MFLSGRGVNGSHWLAFEKTFLESISYQALLILSRLMITQKYANSKMEKARFSGNFHYREISKQFYDARWVFMCYKTELPHSPCHSQNAQSQSKDEEKFYTWLRLCFGCYIMSWREGQNPKKLEKNDDLRNDCKILSSFLRGTVVLWLNPCRNTKIYHVSLWNGLFLRNLKEYVCQFHLKIITKYSRASILINEKV